jgi:uncharacterized protein YlaI
MAKCSICSFRKFIEDREIASTSTAKAIEAYERKHALCPDCLDVGKVSAVVFDDPIKADATRGDGSLCPSKLPDQERK